MDSPYTDMYRDPYTRIMENPVNKNIEDEIQTEFVQGFIRIGG